MNKRVRRALLLLLGVVFAGSLTMTLLRLGDYEKGNRAYAEAEELAGLPNLSALEKGESAAGPERPDISAAQAAPDPYAEALRSMDFAALQEVNADVLGWIVIPGTAISYPILQGEDNSYYLTHTWNRQSSAVGAIFMEQTNRRDFSDFHTILYGHRMNNGSMFAGLKYYKTQSYWAAHPAVYITDGSGTRRYEIFAAYEADVQGQTYRIGISSREAKEAYIQNSLNQSVINTEIVPQYYDQVLTLSTCTGNGHATRWVVQAVLRGTPPAEEPAARESETAAPAADDGTAGLTAEEPMVFAQTETDSAEVPADSDTAEHTEPQA